MSRVYCGIWGVNEAANPGGLIHCLFSAFSKGQYAQTEQANRPRLKN